ncbi:DUF418 domain-containing protein [Tautonia rosea]|uniref:DUF418 domain-containing protein n=1 Tax=Tautonia rosea TaxID=2728037 RepID=UPI00147667FA|nr:DUF418 domain-containing protein [Tautonia rosea]
MATHDPTASDRSDALGDPAPGDDLLAPVAPTPATEPPLVPSQAEPVGKAERLAAVDVLRGVALLGILAMNIVSFAWPFSAYDNPDLSGGPGLLNRSAWMVNQLLFSGKMMTLFSMLFGAGLVLMADRAERRGTAFAWVYYRRVLWLLVIGLIHAYFIWSGDILVAYALCGLVLFLFRSMSPGRLFALGTVLFIGSSLLFSILGLGIGAMRAMAETTSASVGTSEPGRAELAEAWEEMGAFFEPTEEQFAEQLTAYRGSYWEVFPHRAQESIGFQAFFLPLFIWGIAGRMLVGMAFMKWGAFSAERSTRFYGVMALIAYGIGLPLTIVGGLDLWATDFDVVRGMIFGSSLTQLATLPVALGHAAVVMLVVKSGVLPRLTARLAAVGRMALTNYLTQSIVGTLLFYGYGFGLFGTLDRPTLWLIVLAIWAIQLWYSPLWLARFRFGPAEWLWRSLTYLKFQPMRAAKA